MNKTIFIDGKRTKLNQSQLIQSGGEGMVFKMGDTAVKLYHQPTAQHQAKLQMLRQTGLTCQFPPTVLSPKALVTDKQKNLLGFQMALLPPGSQPLKRLSNPIFRQKQSISSNHLITLLKQTHATLVHLHQQQVIVGDLNDTNLFFTPSTQPHTSPFFIDVDSYQFAHFPCPVAMPAFLDPNLYHVADFGSRPYFTTLTDWYAFTVLLVKSLLGVHPYGGAHKRYKSLQSRAQAQVSILDTAVTYPQNALPLDTLSDDLLHHIDQTFEKGERQPFPTTLLARALRSQSSRHRRPSTVSRQPLTDKYRTLLSVSGFIEYMTLQPDGRIITIVYEDEHYRLIRLGIGGKIAEMPLFHGRPGYRFALFSHYLAVNPPDSPQLLLLDIGGSQPQKLTMLETATFQDTAVFAATTQHLYRIAGNWVMRGSVLNGYYVEDAMATAHHQQTQLWAAPYHDTIAGYHRIFAEYRFFVQTIKGSFDLTQPPFAPDEYIADSRLAFGRDTVAVILKLTQQGRVRTVTNIYTLTGSLVNSWPASGDTLDLSAAHYPVTQLPPDLSETAVLRQHRAGLLIQEPQQLLFLDHA